MTLKVEAITACRTNNTHLTKNRIEKQRPIQALKRLSMLILRLRVCSSSILSKKDSIFIFYWDLQLEVFSSE